MKIGFYYFATDYSMPVVELARALEERGFESLFLPEHTHIPASRRTPWPGGAELPQAILPHARPLRRPGGGRGGDQDACASGPASAC